MEFQLFPMDRSHLAAVAAIEQACFSHPWSESMLAEALYDDAASFIVAQNGEGTVLGYAGLHVVLDEGYIDNVAVLPEYRRLGVADALLGALLGEEPPAPEPEGGPVPAGGEAEEKI